MKKGKNTINFSDRKPLSTGGKVALGFSYLGLILWSVIIIWPLLQMVINSFNGGQQKYISLDAPFEFSLVHFSKLFASNSYFLLWIKNTLVIAAATTILTLIFVSFTSFVYSRYRFSGRKASLMAILLIQMVPVFAGITAYYTMHAILQSVIPQFSRAAFLVLIYAGGGIASNTFILKGYIDSISRELDEAARIDGCSNMQVYRLIIMPIAKPMLSIIALWSFIGPFMDYLLPSILLSDPKSYTLATGLFTMITDVRTMDQPAFAAGGLLVAVPIILLFLGLQKQLVSGLSSGAVKG